MPLPPFIGLLNLRLSEVFESRPDLRKTNYSDESKFGGTGNNSFRV
jgi:hypothetical protein